MATWDHVVDRLLGERIDAAVPSGLDFEAQRSSPLPRLDLRANRAAVRVGKFIFWD